MTLSRQQLRALSTVRKRPISKQLGVLSGDLVDRLIEFFNKNRDQNILADALVKRASLGYSIDDPAYLSDKYGQVELQHLEDSADMKDRRRYTVPADPELVARLEAILGATYRTRLSSLQPGGEIRRHIDDPVYTRIISVLSGSHRFLIYKGEHIETVEMAIGELWYVNTAWEHEVRNTSADERIALLANVHELPVIAHA